jgi:DNA-binding FadR family transcriptional regulator
MIKNVHGNTVDYLGEAIIAGRFGSDGALPPEPLLCEELGVSRTVVREAVKALVAKGMIQTGPKVGTRVLPNDQWNWFDPDVMAWQAHAGLTPEFVRDLQDLRLIVEPAAIRFAAQRATAQDLDSLEAAFAGMRHAVYEGGDYVTHDLRFHQGLLRASGNRMLVQMSKALSALLRTTVRAASTDSFITSPSEPVRVIVPLPGMVAASMVSKSPPTSVHANPTTCPTWFCCSARP